MREYLTLPEVAIVWGVSVHEVRRLCEARLLYGAVQLRNRWLIPQDSVVDVPTGCVARPLLALRQA